MSDMAYVDVVFGSEAALAAGRAEIVRRMAELRPRLPGGAVVTVGPAASADRVGAAVRAHPPGPKFHAPMGENAHLTHQSAVRWVRKFQDLMLRPALEAVPGVAEVATLGGETNEVVVQTVGGPAARRERRAVRRDRGAARRRWRPTPSTADEITRDPLLSKVTQASVVAHDGRRRGRRRRRRSRS